MVHNPYRMTQALFIILLLHITGAPDLARIQSRVNDVAPILLEESQKLDLDPVLAGAILFRESGFNHSLTGARGEIGIGQILPTGIARKVCKPMLTKLHNIRENIQCSLLIQNWARNHCGGAPNNWIRSYNASGACGDSRYTRRILKTYGIVKALIPPPVVWDEGQDWREIDYPQCKVREHTQSRCGR